MARFIVLSILILFLQPLYGLNGAGVRSSESHTALWRRKLQAERTNEIGNGSSSKASFKVDISITPTSPTTSTPIPLFTINFNTPVKEADPLSFFRISGAYRIDTVFSPEQGILYILAFVPDPSTAATIKVWLPAGIVTAASEDNVGDEDIQQVDYNSTATTTTTIALSTNQYAEATVQYIPSSSSTSTSPSSSWVGSAASTAYAATVIASFAASILPGGNAGVGLMGLAGYGQTFYMSGTLPLSNMPPLYKEASSKFSWAAFDPPFGVSQPSDTITDDTQGNDEGDDEQQQQQQQQEELVRQLYNSQRFPYPPVKVIIEREQPAVDSNNADNDASEISATNTTGTAGLNNNTNNQGNGGSEIILSIVDMFPDPRQEGGPSSASNPFDEAFLNDPTYFHAPSHEPQYIEEEEDNGTGTAEGNGGNNINNGNNIVEAPTILPGGGSSGNNNNNDNDDNDDGQGRDDSSDNNGDGDITNGMLPGRGDAIEAASGDGNGNGKNGGSTVDLEGTTEGGGVTSLFLDPLELVPAGPGGVGIRKRGRGGDTYPPLPPLPPPPTYIDESKAPAPTSIDSTTSPPPPYIDESKAPAPTSIDSTTSPPPPPPADNGGSAPQPSLSEGPVKPEPPGTGSEEEEEEEETILPVADPPSTGSEEEEEEEETILPVADPPTASSPPPPPPPPPPPVEKPSSPPASSSGNGEEGEGETAPPPTISSPSEPSTVLQTRRRRRRQLLVKDPLSSLSSSGFYIVSTATVADFASSSDGGAQLNNNGDSGSGDSNIISIGASALSRIRTIQVAASTQQQQGNSTGNYTPSSDDSLDAARLDTLWNVLLWTAVALLGASFLHGLIVLGLKVFRSKKNLPKMLTPPRLELLLFMLALPMVAAAAAGLLQSKDAGVIAIGVLFSIVVPIIFLITAVIVVSQKLLKPSVQERRAVFAVPVSSNRHHNHGHGNRTQANGDGGGGGETEEHQLHNNIGDISVAGSASSEIEIESATSSQALEESLIFGASSLSSHQQEGSYEYSHRHQLVNIPSGTMPSPGTAIAVQRQLPSNNRPQSSATAASTASIAGLKSKVNCWMCSAYRYTLCPLLGFPIPKICDPNPTRTEDAAWLGKTKADAGFIKSYGCLFEDARGPRVLEIRSQYDSYTRNMRPSELDGAGAATDVVHGVLLPESRSMRISTLQMLQTLGILINVLKMLLFALIINANGGVDNMYQVAALVLVALIHFLYLRILIPYRLRLELAAEALACLCDVGVFVCGIVLIMKAEWTAGEQEAMGIAMLVLQAVGFLTFAAVRLMLAARTILLTIKGTR